jgi:hypothetical protein
MISPLRNPFDPRVLFPSAPNGGSDFPAAERHSTGGDSALPSLQAVEAPSTWHGHAVSDGDVRRFEPSLHALQCEGAASKDDSEPSFRMSEGALARFEAGLRAQEKRYMPRAGQLPPVFGLRPVESEGSNQGSRQTRNGLSFQPSPPLAPEPLQSQAPMKQQRSGLLILLLVLIAGTITAAVAYHFSTGGVSPELASIKAEPVELSPMLIAPPIETKVNNQTSSDENNQADSMSASQAEAPLTTSAVSTTLIESTKPSLGATVPRLSHRTRVARHSGNAPRQKSP